MGDDVKLYYPAHPLCLSSRLVCSGSTSRVWIVYETGRDPPLLLAVVVAAAGAAARVYVLFRSFEIINS